MDKTTKWLLRIASGVVIISGVGGVSIFLVNSELFRNANQEKINNKKVSNDLPDMIIKVGNCPKSHNISAGGYCLTEEGYDSSEFRNYLKGAPDRAKRAYIENNEKKNKDKDGFWKKLADGLSAAADYMEEEDRREQDRLDREARRHELLNRNNPTVIYRDSSPTKTIIQKEDQPSFTPQMPITCSGFSGRHIQTYDCY